MEASSITATAASQPLPGNLPALSSLAQGILLFSDTCAAYLLPREVLRELYIALCVSQESEAQQLREVCHVLESEVTSLRCAHSLLSQQII